jgi:hypothetical protein
LLAAEEVEEQVGTQLDLAVAVAEWFSLERTSSHLTLHMTLQLVLAAHLA